MMASTAAFPICSTRPACRLPTGAGLITSTSEPVCRTIGLGQIGFTWSILGSGSYTGASKSQMLVGSTDGTMDLWYVSSGALTGIGFGQVLSGRGYIDSGNFTSNGLNNFLVFNQADHHQIG